MKHLCLLLVLVIPLTLHTKEIVPHPERVVNTSGTHPAYGADSTTEVIHLLQGDSIVNSVAINKSAMVNVIVEFTEEPLLPSVIKAEKKYGSRNHAKSVAAIRESMRLVDFTHENFKAGLREIDDKDASKSMICREYSGIFNGISLRTHADQLKKIKQMSSVKSIHADVLVKANLSESVPAIHADAVWALGYTGQGMVVGIIDAGIDYTHPALGGGFGPSYKVIGGYDFVNNDADPMDDNGHGTLVAGVVAANGEVRGVAPDARLVAYKVLDNWGQGLMSDVIAAVEKSCDPDGDPRTDDALDVINLSFSGPGNSNDPLCQAIANATAAGVVCVVAAGEGEAYQTITSPACAPVAITVGASDRYFNTLYYYSPKGPTSDLFAIKPDVIAPGVGIRSTLPAGGYDEGVGTSMAAPHVAGVAALLLQIHPDWSPAEVKQCIMVTADNIGSDVFCQGSGQINAQKAVNLKTMVNPASISLGLDPETSGTFVKSTTMTVTNRGTDAVTYFLTASLNSPLPGISTDIAPSSLFLQPGDSASVLFTAIVNNAVVPEVSTAPYAYSGNVNISGNGESVNVPFAFLKTDVIHMHLREFPSFVIVHDRAGTSWHVGSFDSVTNVLVPRGVYDIMVFYGLGASCRNVIKENISTGSTVEIGISDAVNTVTLNPVDIHGNAMPFVAGSARLVHRSSGVGFDFCSAPLAYFSNASQAYVWDWGIVKYSKDTAYQFLGECNGFSKDTAITTSPSDLKKYTYNIHVPSSINGLRTPLYTWTSPLKSQMSGYTYNPTNPPMNYPFTETAYYMALPSDNFPFGYLSRNVYKYGTSPEQLLFESPCLGIKNDGSFAAYQKNYQGTPFYSSIADTIDIGLGPLFWIGHFDNSSTQMQLRTSENNNQTVFNNQTFDIMQHVGTHPYTLYKNGIPIWTDTLRYYKGSALCAPLIIAPGTYTFSTQCGDYFIRDMAGTVTAALTFNTQLADKNPPAIRDFHIESQGKRTMLVNPEHPATISIELYDNSGAATATAFYRYGADTTWIQIPLSSQGMLFTGVPPSLTQNAYVSMKIVANDASGNEMVCEMSPAYRMQTINHAPVLAAIGNKTVAENAILQFTVAATDIDGDALTYNVSGLPAGATFNPATATFTWLPGFNQAGNYPGVTFTVSDGESIEEETIAITVANVNRTPVLATIGNKTVAENGLLQFTVAATDADGDALTYSATVLPAGAMFDPSTRQFSWQPSFDQSGSYPNIRFSVSDETLTDEKTITITVTNTNRAPVLPHIGYKTVAENQLLQFSLQVSDPDGDLLTCSATGLPAGASFNAATATFSWQPSYTQAGTYSNINFSVTDGKWSVSEGIAITVTNVNRAPVLTPIGNKTVAENGVLQFFIGGTDADGNTLTYSATGLPAGATFNPSTRQFYWQPNYTQAGSYPNIRFIVSDGSLTDENTVTVTVTNTDRAPVLADIGNKTIAENSVLQFTIAAADPDGDWLNYSVTGLPTGASFNTSTATFTWQPSYTQAGSYTNIRFTVTDGALTDYETITVTVTNTDRAPVLAVIGNKTVAENALLQFTLAATDADGDALTYSATGLPAGATFNPSIGELRWQPDFTQAGAYPNIKFTVSDGTLIDDETITVTVTNTNQPPRFIEKVYMVSAEENKLVQFQLTGYDPDSDILTYSAIGLPPGASLDPATATFSWLPTFDQAGTYEFIRFYVTDGIYTDNGSAMIIVTNTNRPPVFQPIDDTVFNENSHVVIPLHCSDPDGDVLTFSTENLPQGAVLNPQTGIIDWNISYEQAGVYPGIKFTVSDGKTSVNMTKSFIVNNVKRPPEFIWIGEVYVNENELLQSTIKGSDPDSNTLTITAENLPAGATLDSATGTLSWRPGFDQAGIYEVTYTVSDGFLSASQPVRYTVFNTNRSPVLAPIGNKVIAEGELLQFTIAASDADGDSISFYAGGLPDGATFDATTATFTWRPTYDQAGTYDGIFFDAYDSDSPKNEIISITVTNTLHPPVLSPVENQTVGENELLQFNISATDPVSSHVLCFVENLPDGASFNEQTNSFEWRPTFYQAGVYPNIIVSAANGESLVNDTFSITVTNTDRAPEIETIGDKTVAENTLLQFSFAALDADGDALTYSATGLPTGATFDPSTATFTWQPGYNQSGSYPGVTFSVSDGELTNDEAITITVTNSDRAPILAIVGNKTVAENALLQFTLAVTDADGDALTYSATGLPTGATFNPATATFTWQPGFNQSGSYPGVTFTVSDGELTDDEMITVTVTNSDRAPVLAIVGNKTVAENALLQFTLAVTDADGDALTYSATGLPTGATFNPATATFTWQPGFNQSGSYPGVTFTVSDGELTDDEMITVTVTNSDRAPVLAIVGNKTVAENALLQFTLAVTDADGDALTYSATGLPTGATFDPATATFTWQPGFNQSGSYPGVTFTVSDGELTDDEMITVTVTNSDRAPVLAIVGNKTVAENAPLQFTLTATDADGDALTYSATGLPTGAAFNPATATFTWQPGFTQAGAYSNIKFIVSGGTLTDDETITVTVTNTNRVPAAVNDVASTNEDVGATISVLNNDSDPDNDQLTVATVSTPAKGTATKNANNTITYVPRLNFYGTDQFTYTISDGHGGTASATVSITVTSVNDAPTVSITSPANGAVFIKNTTVTINATAVDVDGTITKVEFYRNGVYIGQDTSSPYSYSWTKATAGTHSIYCKAYDNSGAITQSATVTITVR